MHLGVYVSVVGSVPQVWLNFNCIFVVMMQGNVRLSIAIGLFVRMTLESQACCGENCPFCGNWF